MMQQVRLQTSACKEREKKLFRQRGDEQILVVDDEPFLVKAHKIQLTMLGYCVTATTNSRDALKRIQTDPKRFDLLITDHMMPGISGMELAEASWKLNPLLPVIFCTGCSDIRFPEESPYAEISRYIFKPIRRDDLLQAIREVLDEK